MNSLPELLGEGVRSLNLNAEGGSDAEQARQSVVAADKALLRDVVGGLCFEELDISVRSSVSRLLTDMIRAEPSVVRFTAQSTLEVTTIKEQLLVNHVCDEGYLNLYPPQVPSPLLRIRRPTVMRPGLPTGPEITFS